MSRFEDNLWAELERDHAPVLLKTVARSRHQRVGVWLGSAAGVAAVGLASVAVYVSSIPPAYEITDNADGSLTLTVREVDGFASAAQDLRGRGIKAAAVPWRRDCAEGEWFKLAHPPTDGEHSDALEPKDAGKAMELRIVPDQLPAGVTLVLAGAQDGEDGVDGWAVYAPGQLPSCVYLAPARDLGGRPLPSIPLPPTPTF